MSETVKKKAVAKKATAIKAVVEEKKVKPLVSAKATDDMVRAVGRRKCAIARVRLLHGEKGITINGKDYTDYFGVYEFQKAVSLPLSLVNLENSFGVSVKVQGGGIRGQAEAVRHGIARALVKHDPELKKTMRSEGFMTRDARVKERKKPGLKRARRAPQFSKR